MNYEVIVWELSSPASPPGCLQDDCLMEELKRNCSGASLPADRRIGSGGNPQHANPTKKGLSGFGSDIDLRKLCEVPFVLQTSICFDSKL